MRIRLKQKNYNAIITEKQQKYDKKHTHWNAQWNVLVENKGNYS